MLRVRTRPKYAKGNQRELTLDSNLNCGIVREREKINQAKHTAGCSQNKETEQFQRRASWWQMAHHLQETGGRGEGKGANSAPEAFSPIKLQRGLQFLTKDFLRFWMVDIRWEGHG